MRIKTNLSTTFCSKKQYTPLFRQLGKASHCYGMVGWWRSIGSKVVHHAQVLCRVCVWMCPTLWGARVLSPYNEWRRSSGNFLLMQNGPLYLTRQSTSSQLISLSTHACHSTSAPAHQHTPHQCASHQPFSTYNSIAAGGSIQVPEQGSKMLISLLLNKKTELIAKCYKTNK